MQRAKAVAAAYPKRFAQLVAASETSTVVEHAVWIRPVTGSVPLLPPGHRYCCSQHVRSESIFCPLSA